MKIDELKKPGNRSWINLTPVEGIEDQERVAPVEIHDIGSVGVLFTGIEDCDWEGTYLVPWHRVQELGPNA